MSIGINQVKPGVTIEIDGVPYLTLNYHHIKMAQMARVKIKLRNMRTGAITERSFNVNEKVERAQIDRKQMQYLYHDENLYHFMDNETFEQVAIPKNNLGEAVSYLLDGATVTILFYGKESLGVDLPTSLVMKVVDTPPGFKGDTASGGSKPAKLESGITVQVPFFVNVGDRVKVDTRSGEYVERA